MQPGLKGLCKLPKGVHRAGFVPIRQTIYRFPRNYNGKCKIIAACAHPTGTTNHYNSLLRVPDLQLSKTDQGIQDRVENRFHKKKL